MQWRILRLPPPNCRSRGVKVTRVMTDNGPCYQSKAFAKACKDFKIKQVHTKPYTPKTTGKAERFIQVALRERPMRAPIKHPTNAPQSCQNGHTYIIGTSQMAG